MYSEVIRRVLGLEICADTEIGGPMKRGVSGGQRKRVTLGEFSGRGSGLAQDFKSGSMGSAFPLPSSYVHMPPRSTLCR